MPCPPGRWRALQRGCLAAHTALFRQHGQLGPPPGRQARLCRGLCFVSRAQLAGPAVVAVAGREPGPPCSGPGRVRLGVAAVERRTCHSHPGRARHAALQGCYSRTRRAGRDGVHEGALAAKLAGHAGNPQPWRPISCRRWGLAVPSGLRIRARAGLATAMSAGRQAQPQTAGSPATGSRPSSLISAVTSVIAASASAPSGPFATSATPLPLTR